MAQRIFFQSRGNGGQKTGTGCTTSNLFRRCHQHLISGCASRSTYFLLLMFSHNKAMEITISPQSTVETVSGDTLNLLVMFFSFSGWTEKHHFPDKYRRFFKSIRANKCYSPGRTMLKNFSAYSRNAEGKCEQATSSETSLIDIKYNFWQRDGTMKTKRSEKLIKSKYLIIFRKSNQRVKN